MNESLLKLKKESGSGNILNEPVSPRDYKLQHRKSIHDWFNTEGGNSNSKNPQGSGDDTKKISPSPVKNINMTGLVSEAFRKQNKYTNATMC